MCFVEYLFCEITELIIMTTVLYNSNSFFVSCKEVYNGII